MVLEALRAGGAVASPSRSSEAVSEGLQREARSEKRSQPVLVATTPSRTRPPTRPSSSATLTTTSRCAAAPPIADGAHLTGPLGHHYVAQHQSRTCRPISPCAPRRAAPNLRAAQCPERAPETSSPGLSYLARLALCGAQAWRWRTHLRPMRGLHGRRPRRSRVGRRHPLQVPSSMAAAARGGGRGRGPTRRGGEPRAHAHAADACRSLPPAPAFTY